MRKLFEVWYWPTSRWLHASLHRGNLVVGKFQVCWSLDDD